MTAKAEYRCLAMIKSVKPGANGSLKRAREIAKARAISERYLVHIPLQLKTAGQVQNVANKLVPALIGA